MGGRWHFSRPAKDREHEGHRLERGARALALRPAGCCDLASFLAGPEGAWLRGPTVPSPQLLEGRKGLRGGEPRTQARGIRWPIS